MTLREIGRGIDEAIRRGDVKVTVKPAPPDAKGQEEICAICRGKTDTLGCYVWFVLNDDDYPDIITMVFCTKECWKKYLEKEKVRV